MRVLVDENANVLHGCARVKIFSELHENEKQLEVNTYIPLLPWL